MCNNNEFDFNAFEIINDRELFNLLINSGSSYDESMA